jgi:hypothetical protein
LQKKTEIRAEKGQTKKVYLIGHKGRKENPISAPSIHVGALVGAGLLWPTLAHTVALPFPLTSILRQNKNYGNSNISPCKNIIIKKDSKRNQNPSRYYISITNIKFQYKPKCNFSKICI